ncbi:MAG: glutamate--tRNA ligase [Alphaproteobacteria bacterium]|nr:glutamate--tRNA ligase [Alphaproteobacteria bacterium]
MAVVTRFAPSPTGFLHIGGARTALFNWLFAKHHGGEFLLRIEDTDRKRSTPESVAAILDGLRWLELEWDREAFYQSQRADRHAAAARELLAQGGAYYCYCSAEELAEMRETAKREGHSMRYDGRWRDRDPADAPAGIDPVIRLKAPREGETVIEDQVQGPVRVANSQLDDMILLRSDGTPTYMLSVVVDDHDMGVTHVIRGDDHLTNAARQTQLFRALGWDEPVFGHIPLIHGADGQKLSKRHGALGIDAYQEMGYLPAALRNYLLRLGWGHGDDEIISTEQAVEWFDLDGVGKSAARIDFAKLEYVNGQYLRNADAAMLVEQILPRLTGDEGSEISETARTRLEAGIGSLTERAKNLNDLADMARFYAFAPQYPLSNTKAAKLLQGDGLKLLGQFAADLEPVPSWTEETLEQAARDFAEARDVGLGKVAQPLRAALTGSNASPGIFEVLHILGKEEALSRLASVPDIDQTS